MLVDALFDPLSIAVLVIIIGMIAVSASWYSRGKAKFGELVERGQAGGLVERVRDDPPGDHDGAIGDHVRDARDDLGAEVLVDLRPTLDPRHPPALETRSDAGVHARNRRDGFEQL